MDTENFLFALSKLVGDKPVRARMGDADTTYEVAKVQVDDIGLVIEFDQHAPITKHGRRQECLCCECADT